jgi:iron complex outermembrane receptor protein
MFKADAYGFELEAGSVPVKNLSVYSSFSYNRFYFSQNIHSPADRFSPFQAIRSRMRPSFWSKRS